jgi:hypothetical protein
MKQESASKADQQKGDRSMEVILCFIGHCRGFALSQLLHRVFSCVLPFLRVEVHAKQPSRSLLVLPDGRPTCRHDDDQHGCRYQHATAEY